MKRAYIKISLEVLANMFRESDVYTRVTRGVPKDAKFLRATMYAPSMDPAEESNFYMVFEHDSFPEIKEGCIMDSLIVEVKSILESDDNQASHE